MNGPACVARSAWWLALLTSLVLPARPIFAQPVFRCRPFFRQTITIERHNDKADCNERNSKNDAGARGR